MKTLHEYFSISADRAEEMLTIVSNSFVEKLKDRTLKDINAIKHAAFEDSKKRLNAEASECGLIGIMVEQAYNGAAKNVKE